MEETMNNLKQQIDKKITDLTKEEIKQTNIDYLGKLVDVKKDLIEMEEEDMRIAPRRSYGTYGENYRGNYGNYGENYGGRRPGYNTYGRQGVDMKYRGDDMIDEMAMHYGSYMENKENGRYGSLEMTKALDYMLQSVEEFMRMLKEDAGSQEEVEKIRKTARRIADM